MYPVLNQIRLQGSKWPDWRGFRPETSGFRRPCAPSKSQRTSIPGGEVNAGALGSLDMHLEKRSSIQILRSTCFRFPETHNQEETFTETPRKSQQRAPARCLDHKALVLPDRTGRGSAGGCQGKDVGRVGLWRHWGPPQQPSKLHSTTAGTPFPCPIFWGTAWDTTGGISTSPSPS